MPRTIKNMQEPNINSYSISLRIYGGSQTPDEQRRKLNLPSSVSNERGTKRLGPTGQTLGGNYSRNYCCFDLHPKEGENIEEAINSCVEFLEQKRRALDEISDGGADIVLYISWFVANKNVGFTLDKELLSSAAASKFSITLDVYPPHGELR